MAEAILIVRHGETEWSLSGRHTSVTNLPLTGHGREQAAALADRLSREHFELVLCSPLGRARETCELAGYGDVAEICDDLHEWRYGDFEGMTTPEIHTYQPTWDLWRDGCPGGESPAEIGARVDRVLARMSRAHGDAIAFAHGHVLRVLAARWLRMEVAAGARFKLAPAGVGVLGYERETEVIERWSA